MNIIFKTWVYSRCEREYISACKKANVPHNDALELIEKLMRYFEKKPLEEYENIDDAFVNFFMRNINLVIKEKVNYQYILKKIREIEIYQETESFQFESEYIVLKDYNQKIIEKILINEIILDLPELEKHIK